jgi:hypothetical protein
VTRRKKSREQGEKASVSSWMVSEADLWPFAALLTTYAIAHLWDHLCDPNHHAKKHGCDRGLESFVQGLRCLLDNGGFGS